jgi:rod shape-determining protein MreB
VSWLWCNLRYLPGKGVVIDEPTAIALDTRNGKVAAVGREAKTLARRQPREIHVARPVRDGAVADCEAAGQMLSQFIRRALTHRSLGGLSQLPGLAEHLNQELGA